jgi:hypothetical protein
MANPKAPTSHVNEKGADLHSANTMLKRLLLKGDYVAVKGGNLIIKAKTKDIVPDYWYKKHHDNMVRDIANLLGVPALQFISFNTGKYGRHKADGVHLQFEDLTSPKDAYAIFNVDLARKRTTKTGKKGEPLSGKQFSVPKKSYFRQFWITTGLTEPDRSTKYSGYMGNLKPIVFTANYQGTDAKRERLEKKSIRPLSISYQDLIRLVDTTYPSDELNMHNP